MTRPDFIRAKISVAEVDALRERAESAEAEATRLRAMVEAVKPHLASADYDYPGDAPELCGYTCTICQKSGAEIEEIEHSAECALAALEAK